MFSRSREVAKTKEVLFAQELANHKTLPLEAKLQKTTTPKLQTKSPKRAGEKYLRYHLIRVCIAQRKHAQIDSQQTISYRDMLWEKQNLKRENA